MVALVQMKYHNLASMMDERLKRHWAALRSTGRGIRWCLGSGPGHGTVSLYDTQGNRRSNRNNAGTAREIEVVFAAPAVADGRSPQADATLCRDLESLVTDSTLATGVAVVLDVPQHANFGCGTAEAGAHGRSHDGGSLVARHGLQPAVSNRKIEEGKQSPDRARNSDGSTAGSARFSGVVSRWSRSRQAAGNPGNMKNPGKE